VYIRNPIWVTVQDKKNNDK